MAAVGIGTAGLMIVAGYLLGCFNTAYYWIRWHRGEDIRQWGTGNAGATNAGRLLGKWGFLLVFLLDLAKGALAVGLARKLGLYSFDLGAVAVAVVCGHVWPIQLEFAGGKGIATSLGAMAVLDPRALAVMAAAFAGIYPLCRRFNISGLMAFLICPLGLLALSAGAAIVISAGTLTGIVWVAHRSNLRAEYRRWRAAKAKPPAPADG